MADASTKRPPTVTLREFEIDDVIYFARVGDNDEISATLKAISERTDASQADILFSAQDEDGRNSLHMAAGNGLIDTVKYLLAPFLPTPSPIPPSFKSSLKALFLNHPNSAGNTPLHWAAERGHIEIVKLLCAEGADPAIQNNKGDIPLDAAQFGMRSEIERYFLGQIEGLEGQNSGAGGKEGNGLEKAMVAAEIADRDSDDVEVITADKAKQVKDDKDDLS